jgi:hypothetical protein
MLGCCVLAFGALLLMPRTQLTREAAAEASARPVAGSAAT